MDEPGGDQRAGGTRVARDHRRRVVAAEMATAYASFGTRVTLLVRGELLPAMEPFASALVADALTARGGGPAHGRGGRKRTPHGRRRPPRALRRCGRRRRARARRDGPRPPHGRPGLDAVGIAPGGWLAVDDTLRVSGTDWLYAVGDVNGRALLTHQGKYQARAAGDVIAARAHGAAVDDAPWGAHVATADHAAVPQVTFTDPRSPPSG